VRPAAWAVETDPAPGGETWLVHLSMVWEAPDGESAGRLAAHVRDTARRHMSDVPPPPDGG